jgi:hypothetical protein
MFSFELLASTKSCNGLKERIFAKKLSIACKRFMGSEGKLNMLHSFMGKAK